MKVKFNFIFLTLIYFTSYLCYESNNFEFNLVSTEIQTGTFISPTISKDGYLYIVTGNDEDLPNKQNIRFIMRIDLDTMSLSYWIAYQTFRGFYGGEAYAFSAKNNYLFIPAISGKPQLGSYELINLGTNSGNFGAMKNDSSIYGIRRSFIQAGSYYYFMHLSNTNYLYIKKMQISKYSTDGDFPIFKIVKEYKTTPVKSKAMISCDMTLDKKYILCAFHNQENRTILKAFDSDLNYRSESHYDIIQNFTGEEFIKILYFKGSSNFIFMYTYTYLITRLWYFNYQDDTETNLLNPIVNNALLDIYDTQRNGNYGNNDVFIQGNDRVIKIFANNFGNDIIITIIQFYENDSYMTIKIYNMKNGNGFNYFKQTRISLSKNSIIFCSSAEKNNIRLPGFALINYPNVKDITLWGPGIPVENLGLKIDTFFHVNAKLKILSIPSGILFENFSSKRIYINDELELDDGLIIIEYRINRGFDYIIKYQAIARGNDLGYNIIKKYPINKDIKDYNDIFLEGRKGQLTVNITSCLNNFYPLEDNLNLCTTIKYTGYYLDINSKIYRHCPSPCSDCDTPINNTHKNCFACKSGYYLTEDTKYCYNGVIENYYIDGNMLRRCHSKCLYCSKGSKNDLYMNCTTCYPNWYLTEDTHSCYDHVVENYYKDGKILRRCHKNCLECFSKEINSTYMNCKKCYPNWFMTEDTQSCYDHAIEHYYIDGDTLRRCHENCLQCFSKEINSTYMNCKKCNPNWYLTEDTHSCYDQIIEHYYLDGDILRRCHENCLECFSKEINSTYMNCKKCYPNWFMTEDTYSCYNKIIENYYLDGDTLRRCNKNCLECFSKEKNSTYMNCKKCYPNWFMTEDTLSCYDHAIEHYYIDGDTLRRCYKNCLDCFSKETNYTHMNCKKCNPNWYLTEDTKSCYNDIIDNYYLDGDILRRCHKNCLHCSTNENNHVYMNCTKCLEHFFMTEDTNSCYDKIIDNYYLDNTILRRCHKNCLSCSKKETNNTFMNCLKCKENYFMTEDTNSCYDNIIDNYYKDNNTLKRCHPNCLQCYSAPINSSHMNCKKCQKNLYKTEDTESCYDNVIDNYYKDNDILRRCHKNCLHCSMGSINNTYMSCTKCKKNFYITEDTNSCYDYIPNNYYLDKVTYSLRRCFSRCSECIEAKNNQTQNCLGCSNSSYFYKRETFDCVLKEEISTREKLEFSKKDNVYFYIFVGIFIAALLILIINCAFYKIEKEKKEDQWQKVENKQENNENQNNQNSNNEEEKSDDNSDKELEPIN